jgi:cell division protein FtsQ
MRAGAIRAGAQGGRSAAPEASSGWRRFARSNRIVRRLDQSLFTRRTVLKTAVVAGLALVFAFAAWGAARWLTRVSWLPISEVRIEGLRHVGKAEALDLMGVSEGRNILSVSPAEMVRRAARSPWIKGISVNRHLPASLRVQIEERAPVAVLHREKGGFLVDSEGRAIMHVDDARLWRLPVVSGLPVRRIAPGEQVDARNLAVALDLARFAAAEKRLGASEAIEIWAGDPNDLSLFANGIEIRVGRGEYAEKFGRWFLVADQLSQRVPDLAVVDLRFQGQVIVRSKEEAGGGKK